MSRDDGVIGTKPREDFGPLFAKPQIITPKSLPPRRVSLLFEQHAADNARAVYERLDAITWDAPAMYAVAAAATDNAERLLLLAARVADCILDATGRMAVWEVRVQLLRLRLVDGTEKMDCLGALGTRMGLIAIDTERPPYLAELDASHRNRNTVWARREDARRSA